MKISVVIPLYNRSKYIGRAVQSVLEQKYTDFELIVVDDGSVDCGGDIVLKFMDPRIRLVQQENMGVSAARNRGINEARSSYVAFLDSDDVWMPEYLQTIIMLMKKYPEAGIYASSYMIVGIDQSEFIPTFKEIELPPWEGIIYSFFRSSALGYSPITASSVCVPKHILLEMEGFNVGKRMGEDLDLWGRIALKYPIAFSTKIGAVYHKDAEKRACFTFSDGDEHPFNATFEEFCRLGKIPTNIINDVDLYVTLLKVENMRQHVLGGNYLRARELAKGLKVYYFPFRLFLWGSQFNTITRIIWCIWSQKVPINVKKLYYSKLKYLHHVLGFKLY